MLNDQTVDAIIALSSDYHSDLNLLKSELLKLDIQDVVLYCENYANPIIDDIIKSIFINNPDEAKIFAKYINANLKFADLQSEIDEILNLLNDYSTEKVVEYIEQYPADVQILILCLFRIRYNINIEA